MNYKEYMKAVEERLSTMGDDEKNEVIRNIARGKNESDRDAFLVSLGSVKETSSYSQEIEKLWEWITKVDEGKIYFACSAYEEEGMDLWESDYALDYEDPFDIKGKLTWGLQLAEMLLYKRAYREALALYDALLHLRFLANNRDTEESDELDIDDALDEGLVKLDYKHSILLRMYAGYQAMEEKARARELFQSLSLPKCLNVRIEEMFGVGPDTLRDTEAFFEEWIEFLMETPGDRAGELLYEAAYYHGGIDRLIPAARLARKRHPILYVYACQHLLKEQQNEACENLGMEALEHIPAHFIIRGAASDCTALAAKRLGHKEVQSKCIETAFYSHSTLSNYLRLFELAGVPSLTKEAARYAKDLPERAEEKGDKGGFQTEKNNITALEKEVIQFFSGELEGVVHKCQEDPASLGWSSSLKGVIIPLLVLCMHRGPSLTKSGELLWGEVLRKLGIMEDGNPRLTPRFLHWKKCRVISIEDYETYRDWIRKEVEKRVDAVVAGGYRYSYHKAALLIVTYGEMLESRGLENGKDKIVEQFKKKYPRKRAFRGEFNSLDL